MLFRRTVSALSCLAFAAVAAGQQPHSAQPPEPLVLRVDGDVLDDDQQLVLLTRPGTVEVSASPPVPAAGEASPSAAAGEFLEQQWLASYQWSADSGLLRSVSPGTVRWSSAAPGEAARLSVSVEVEERTGLQGQESPASAASSNRAGVTLLAPVNFDRTGSGVLDGVVIGVYPDETAEDAPSVVSRNPGRYEPPEVLYRLDASTRDLYLNRRATMGMLNPALFEGETDEKRYVAVSPRLLAFWDALCAAADESESGAHRLKVLRGFATPYERQRLDAMGVEIAPFSRHLYGDALVLILDGDGDGRMDDLNGDGDVDIEDAERLAVLVEDAYDRSGMDGGMGVGASFPGPRFAGTPYVHADLRGWEERWRDE